MNNLVVLQQAIAATGTPQNLPNNPIFRSVTFSAKVGNAAAVVIGSSSAVTASTGFLLAAGTSVTLNFPGNTNVFWIVGTAADVYSVIGE